MKAFVRGPISIIEVQEKNSEFCETTCDFMNEHPDETIYCELFSEDLEEESGEFYRCLECLKSEVRTQFDEEGNLI
jgi:hypothetical protein